MPFGAKRQKASTEAPPGVDEVKYALDGLQIGNAADARDSLKMLAKAFSNQETRRQILFQRNKASARIPKLACTRLLTCLQGKPSPNIVLACVVLTQLLYLEEDLEDILEPEILNRIAVATGCIPELARWACAQDASLSVRTNSVGRAELEKLGLDPKAVNLPAAWSALDIRQAAVLALDRASYIQVVRMKRCPEEKIEPSLGASCTTIASSLAMELKRESLDLKRASYDKTGYRVSTLVRVVERFTSVHPIALQLTEQSDMTSLLEGLVHIPFVVVGPDVPPSQLPEWVSTFVTSALRIVANMTHSNSKGCQVMRPKPLEEVLSLLGTVSGTEKRSEANPVEPVAFDITLVLLGILTNCVETDAENRKLLGRDCKKIVQFFSLFLPVEVEEKLNAGSQTEDLEFGWTAEELVTCAYACLLMGCLMRSSKDNQQMLQENLAGHSVVILMQVLDAYLAYLEDAQVLSSEALKQTLEIMAEMRAIALSQQRPQDRKSLEMLNKRAVPPPKVGPASVGLHAPRASTSTSSSAAKPAPPAPPKPTSTKPAATRVKAPQPKTQATTRSASAQVCQVVPTHASRPVKTTRESTEPPSPLKKRKAVRETPQAITNLDDVF